MTFITIYKRYVSLIFIVMILISIILPLLSLSKIIDKRSGCLSIVNAQSLHEKPLPEDLIKRSFKDLLDELLRSKGITIDSSDKLYRYYYAGRVIRICGEDLYKIGLLNKDPREIFFGAYVNNSWVEIPFRIYDDVIRGAGYIQYIPPERINMRTCVEIMLPDQMSIDRDPSIDKPDFARGSEARKIFIEIFDKDIMIKIPIYVFTEAHPKDPYKYLRYHYDYISNTTYVVSQFRTSTKIYALDLLYESKSYYMKRYSLSEEEFKRFTRVFLDRSLEPINRDVATIQLSIDPVSIIVPDGGSGGGPSYNYVERQPLLLNKVVSGRVLTTIALGPSNGSYTDIFFTIEPEMTSWYIYNPVLKEVELELYVYGNDTYSRSMYVTVDGETRSYTITPGVINKISFYKYYYDGRRSDRVLDYNFTYSISIMSPGGYWYITGRPTIYYDINQTAINTYLMNFTYSTDLFTSLPLYTKLSYASVPDLNYSLKTVAIIATPFGGYSILDMSNLGTSLSLTLNGVGQVVSWGAYAWANISIKICITPLLCDTKYIAVDNTAKTFTLTFFFKGPASTSIYNVLYPFLISGEIPINIEIKLIDGVGLYNPTYGWLSIHLDLYPQNIPRATIYFKTLVGRQPLSSDYYPATNYLLYTSLYKALLGNFDAVLSRQYGVYSSLSTGLFVNIRGTNSAMPFNQFYSNTGFLIFRHWGLLDITFLEIGFDGVGTYYADYSPIFKSTSATYSDINVTIYPLNTQLTWSGAYQGFKFDRGPGSSLPNASEVAAILGVLAKIFTILVPPLGQALTVLSVVLYGYDVVKRASTNEISCYQRSDSAIICRWVKGSLSSCSNQPIDIYVDRLGSSVSTIQVRIYQYTKICTDAGEFSYLRSYDVIWYRG